jgi:hypothetical protein
MERSGETTALTGPRAIRRILEATTEKKELETTPPSLLAVPIVQANEQRLPAAPAHQSAEHI